MHAKQSIANTETYKKCNVGDFTEQTLAYVFSKSILNPGKDIQVKGIPANKNPVLGNVDGGIGIKNFKALCRKYINNCDDDGEAPSSLTFNGFEIGVKAWCYATARVVVYYWEKKRFPNKVITTYKPFYIPPKPKPEPKPTFKKYGHATEYGCDNRGQNTDYYCGCHAVQEIVRNLTGVVVPQRTIAEWAGTTYDGTDHQGLETAIAQINREYGLNLKVKWYNYSELGREGLRKIIESDNMDFLLHLLYRLLYGHYENLNKTYDDYVDVQNSLGDRCNENCFCGYTEERYWSTLESYIAGISQKSVMVVTNDG